MSLIGKTPISENGSQFHLPTTSVTDPAQQQAIVSVKILPVGDQSAAAVCVSLTAEPQNDSSNQNTKIEGWLTLLKKQQSTASQDDNPWTCIGAAFATSAVETKILPSHFQDVTKLVWDGYCHANRTCNGTAMAKVFHPSCRLTYVNSTVDKDDDGIVVCPQPAFCDKVENRYTSPNESMHVPFAPLQNHVEIGRYDGIQSIEFAGTNTPRVCMVTLKVAHPPFVWTDLLTSCDLSSSSSNGNNNGTTSTTNAEWWIVHKSSCNEAYELTEDMKAVLAAAQTTNGSGSRNYEDGPLGLP